ncbi:MAG: GNAT family N-acetyltransferase [Patescibacteria group bacterium]
MKILKASKKHIPSIAKIISVLDNEHYHFSDIHHITAHVSKGWYYLALEKNRPVGAMCLEPTEGSYQIYSIASQQKGAGRSLIQFAIQKCKKEKIPKLWCWSLLRYHAVGFYKAMGFKERFLFKKQWYGEDCYIFGKTITQPIKR